jgi:hypothetical protein
MQECHGGNMERRDFLRYASFFFVAAALPLGFYKEAVAHETVDLYKFLKEGTACGWLESENYKNGKILIYPDHSINDPVRAIHLLERIHMDTPTSAKPGQYRYVVTTPCDPFPPREYERDPRMDRWGWERGTFLDFKPGVDFSEVKAKILETLEEHKVWIKP